MYKLLIPLVAVLLGTATFLHAQVPVPAVIANPVNIHPSTHGDAPELVCNNFAGTFVLGQTGVNTQSNDLSLNTIFLCFGDSIFINHNGDAILTGDPVPATTPGVGWAFYECAPYITGDSLKNIVTDTCILLSPTTNLPVLGVGSAEGDIWFFNSGTLQTTYNSGKPVEFHFAPITIDNFGIPPTYESPQVGAPPGPCVNVNTAVEFSVVYLNAITATGISTNFNNDCLGKFRVRGGFPEWDPTALYTIDISLATNSNVKALIHTSASQFFHSADIIFSVTQFGQYNITIEDGKSCGYTFQMNMGGCNPADNVVLTLPELTAPPGTQVCVPLTVENFSQIVSTNLSLEWDPTVLQYTGVQNYAIPASSLPTDVLNTQLVAQGQLGVALNQNNGNPFTVINGNTLFEVCFTTIGQLGDCSTISISNSPTQIGVENGQGNQQAITADTGQVCINFTPLTMLVEFIDTTCLGTATLKVTVTGGQAPYDVIIQSGPTLLGSIPTSGGMYAVSGAQNGTYIIRVIDDNGAGQELIDTVTLNLTTLGVALDLTKLPSCNGAHDGVITANVFVGSTPAPDPTLFDYVWKPDSISENSYIIDSLAGGVVYYVTVTDTNGCIAVASGTLGQPASLNEQTVTITDAACNGVEDGSISYVMEGGTPFPGSEYLFKWGYSPVDTGSTGDISIDTTNPSVLTQLAAGFYYLTVTDANGCVFSPTEPLEVKNMRTVEIQVINIDNATCFGAANGSVSVEVISTPPFTNPNFFFIWPNGIGTDSSTATTSTLSGIPAGVYGVLAGETSGCGDTAFVTVTEPLQFVLDTISIVNPTCTNQNDGSIHVFGSGGTGLGNTFTYTWTPGTLPSNQQVSNLAPGTYSVTASDANGCSDSLSFVLTLPPPPAITQVDSTSVKCGSDGCLTVTAPTGTSFVWQNNIGDTIATTAQACNLSGGIYSVEVRDSNNCVTIDTFALDSVDVLLFSATNYTLPSCYGDSNGIISVGVMGGTTPYTYLWTPTTPAQTTNTLIQAKAGIYTLQVTDANACVLQDTFQLLDAPEIKYELDLSTYQPATCADSCNGQAALKVHYLFDGDTLSGAFSFLWDDGSTDSLRIDLCPGLHDVTISDGNNCFVIGQIVMQAPDSIKATLTTTPVTCFGGSDGSAIAVGTGGNGAPFEYDWNNSDSTATITNLTAGNYAVTISDQNGCQAIFSADVIQPDSITLTPTVIDDIACFGQNDGTLSVDVAGGNPGVFTYSWSDGTNVIGTTNPLEMLAAGTYSVTATDAKGCTGVLGNIVLPDALPVQGAYVPLDTLQCNGDETTLNIDTIFGGAGGPYQYSLDFGVTLNPNFPINIGGGEHYITYFDRRNCEFTDTIFVMEPAPILVSFDPVTIEIELGDSIKLQPIISGANINDLTYIWTPADRLLNLPTLTPTVYTFESEVFTLVVTDPKGCVGTGSVVVDVDPNRNVYLPNVFIPGNPRGLNDHFSPLIGRGVEMINYMRIYDRWGTLMYERTSFIPDGDNFSDGWDGKYDGKFVNPAVFVYVVEARFLDGKVLIYRGDVTVVR